LPAMSSKKRPREDAGGKAAPTAAAAPPTIGQQTSHIKNKLVRSETYAKLLHKKKVRTGCRGTVKHPAHYMSRHQFSHSHIAAQKT
jgi:hypothetical protein